jgi:light-regulated signal transduction histidine kinase (bacteriophytochrome)
MDDGKQNNNLFEKVDIGTKNYQELYERGLKLIKSEPEPKKLMMDILDEYLERLEGLPPIDFNTSKLNQMDSETKEKVKSLVLFGTQAALIRENAKIQAELRQANENYRDLLSVVTSEFDKSISSISGYVQIIKKRLEENKYESIGEISHFIDRLSKNMYGIVDTLRCMSLIDQEKLSIEARMFDLVYDALNPIIAEMDVRLQKKGMHIKLNSHELSHTFQGDERYFKLAFRNLIQNAIQYGNQNSEISIEIERKDKQIKITVYNEGAGLNPNKMDKIFNKYSRFHDKNDKTNVGIGLYAVKNIIEAHGGSIKAESEFSRWMRITIILTSNTHQL